MKLDYDKINANICALQINNKMPTVHLETVTQDYRLAQIELIARFFGVSIAELLFGEIKPKHRVCNITMDDGDKKTFYVPIDKFDSIVKMIEEISDD